MLSKRDSLTSNESRNVNFTNTNSNGSSGLGPRSAKACNLCRKMKQRCDAVDRFPEKCTRCSKRNAPCEFDGSRARSSWVPGQTSVRSGAEAAAIIMMLMSAPTDQPTIDTATSVKDVSTADISTTTDDSQYGTPQTNLSKSASALDLTRRFDAKSTEPESREFVLPFSPLEDQIIDNVFIEARQLQDMYFAYLKYCHPLFPVIPEKYLLKDSPLFSANRPLFWAMCSVGSVLTHLDLAQTIYEHAKKQANSESQEYLLNPYRDMSAVFALIVLSHWPSKSSRLQKEPNWILSGNALHIAMQIGLHHSSNSPEYSLIPLDEQTREICWLGCVVTNQTNAMVLGLPATVSTNWCGIDDHIVLKNSQEKHLYSTSSDIAELIKQSRFLRVYARAAQALCGNADQKYGLALPQARAAIHQSVYDELSVMITDFTPMSTITEITALSTKLNLHLIMLLPGTLEKDVKNVIIPIYVICLQISSILKNMLDDGEQCASLPLIVSRTALIVTITFYRLLVSKYKHMIDENTVLGAIADNYRFLRASYPSRDSFNPHDRNTTAWPLRALSVVQDMFVANELSPQLCTVSTRQGVGILISTLMEIMRWILKKPERLSNDDDQEMTDSNTTKTAKTPDKPFYDKSPLFSEEFSLVSLENDPELAQLFQMTTW